MKRFRKWLLVILIAWGIFGAVCLMVRYLAGVGAPVKYVRLTEFFICKGPDPATGLPQEPMTTIPATMETVYACGYLEVDDLVSLQFLIAHEDESKDWFVLDRWSQTGYLFEPIPQSYRQRLGHYRVEAWCHRANLASTEFRVVENRE